MFRFRYKVAFLPDVLLLWGFCLAIISDTFAVMIQGHFTIPNCIKRLRFTVTGALRGGFNYLKILLVPVLRRILGPVGGCNPRSWLLMMVCIRHDGRLLALTGAPLSECNCSCMLFSGREREISHQSLSVLVSLSAVHWPCKHLIQLYFWLGPSEVPFS